MNVLDLGEIPDRVVDRFESSGFTIGALAAAPGRVRISTARLAAGGSIGSHPAVGQQLLLPVIGSVRVQGEDEAVATIGPGSAVLWSAGEVHRTDAITDAVLVIIEGPDLEAMTAAAPSLD